MEINNKINTKFNYGDTCYTIENKRVKTACTSCEQGYIYFKDKAFKCPDCLGTGEVYSNLTLWNVVDELVKIGSIRVNIHKQNYQVRYRVHGSTNFRNRPEEQLFKTKEEALRVCEKYNKKKEAQ